MHERGRHVSTEARGVERLVVGGDAPEAEVLPFLTGELAVYSAKNPESDGHNEDAAAVIPIDGSRGILVVADGAGGLPGGRDASGAAIEALREAVRLGEEGEAGLRHAILDGFEAANTAVQALGVGAATTLVVAEIDRASFRPYHVGDSMVLVTGQRGKRKLETIPHSPTGYAVESGLMNEQEAIDHEERHLVSNLVGMRDMRIEIGARITLAARDTVVLASDGLSDNLYTSEIVARIRKGPLRVAANALAVDCRNRVTGRTGPPSKPDDVTFIAYRPGRAAQ